MKKIRLLTIVITLVVSLIIVTQGKSTHAESLEEIEAQIADLSHQMQLSVDATTPLEAEVDNLNGQIASIQNQIKAKEESVRELEAGIEEREGKIKTQYVILASKVRDYYKKSRMFSPILILVSSQSAGDLTKELTYKSVSADEDKNLIVAITSDIIQLEADKEQVERDRVGLAGLQDKLDAQRAFFEQEISGAKKWQAELSGKIASLTAKQQAILSARSGSYITGVGSVPIGSDYDASIAGFNENAPGGSFAVFSFGAYTHRKGMSQYGAKARAESQSYEDILEAYYGKRPVEKDTSGDIIVDGVSMNFEEHYLLGIAEMPSSWPAEALKAQAVAARTYAYRYKQEGKSICITESCQVYNSGKADNPPAEWRQAVEQTRGKVLEDVVTYYSSTSGGYLSTSGWDTSDKSGDGDWTSRAWESVAGSPWFYKAWYREEYYNNSSDCGRKPWMSEEEMADIINAWLVLNQGEGNGIDTGRILPVTINNCSIGGQGGDPYSMDELRSKISNAVTSISGEPSLSHDGSGNTTTVRFQTNRGEMSIPGYEFKEVLNTRAPGYISIPQSRFAFYNIERK